MRPPPHMCGSTRRLQILAAEKIVFGNEQQQSAPTIRYRVTAPFQERVGGLCFDELGADGVLRFEAIECADYGV